MYLCLCFGTQPDRHRLLNTCLASKTDSYLLVPKFVVLTSDTTNSTVLLSIPTCFLFCNTTSVAMRKSPKRLENHYLSTYPLKLKTDFS